ncbi:MAG: cupin domain-containing protein [Asgard group archaeon]|nr:cupin domain-containing protein [Asgard group archaeon]
MSFINHDHLEEKELVPGFNGKFIHSENMTFAFWRVKEGSIAPEHKHPHEQVLIIIEGNFEFTLNGETKIIEPGMSVNIPSNAVHSGKAITDCYLIDVFHPIREDFK